MKYVMLFEEFEANEGALDFLRSKTSRVREFLRKASGNHYVEIDGEKHSFVLDDKVKFDLTGERKNTLKIEFENGKLLLRNDGFWKIKFEDGAESDWKKNSETDSSFKEMVSNIGHLLGKKPEVYHF